MFNEANTVEQMVIDACVARGWINVPASGTIPNTKDFALVDLFASYEYSDWIRGDLTLSNIGDVRYIKYLDLDRSPGFQARGGLTIKFATR